MRFPAKKTMYKKQSIKQIEITNNRLKTNRSPSKCISEYGHCHQNLGGMYIQIQCLGEQGSSLHYQTLLYCK